MIVLAVCCGGIDDFARERCRVLDRERVFRYGRAANTQELDGDEAGVSLVGFALVLAAQAVWG